MKKSKSKNGIVKKMREIRDSVSQEIMNMSLEDQKAYFKKMLIELKKKNNTRKKKSLS